MDETGFVQRLAPATRHEITGHSYAEIDLTGAHLSIAWAAVVRHEGSAEAARKRCPMLAIAATDRERAVGLIEQQAGQLFANGVAKRKLLAALNQQTGDGIPRVSFLERFVGERPAMIEAMRRQPLIIDVLAEIEARAASGKGGITLLSCMLQSLENKILVYAMECLQDIGWETGALIADGLFARPRTPNLLAVADEQERARLAVEKAGVDLNLAVRATLDHAIRA